jgi:hypothetical protein
MSNTLCWKPEVLGHLELGVTLVTPSTCSDTLKLMDIELIMMDLQFTLLP